jgi:hypothetical protein
MIRVIKERLVMNSIIKKDSAFVDNFEGWEDGVEGSDRPECAGIIQGTLLKFSNEATWVTRDDDEIPADLELVTVDVGRVVQKWEDGRPVETIVLEPHQKFPDIVEMNEKIPREDWLEGPDGKPRGPWQAQHILYLVDLKTMDKYTFPTGTTGGGIAIRDLRDKLVWIRRLRGQNVYPAVTLGDTFMKTRFGGRQRPHFTIVRWVRLGGEGGEVEALPPPPSSPTPASSAQSESPLVPEPSLAEEMDDEIPDLGNDEAAPPPKKPVKTSVNKAQPNRRRVSTLEAG